MENGEFQTTRLFFLKDVEQISRISCCISFDPVTRLFHCFIFLPITWTELISFTFSRSKLIILNSKLFLPLFMSTKSKLRLFSSCTTKRKQMVLKMKFVLKVQIKNMVFHFFLHNIKKKIYIVPNLEQEQVDILLDMFDKKKIPNFH